MLGIVLRLAHAKKSGCIKCSRQCRRQLTSRCYRRS